MGSGEAGRVDDGMGARLGWVHRGADWLLFPVSSGLVLATLLKAGAAILALPNPESWIVPTSLLAILGVGTVKLIGRRR